HVLIDGRPEKNFFRKRTFKNAAPASQVVAQCRDRRHARGQLDLLGVLADFLAQAGEIENFHFHDRYSSEYGRKRTRSPLRIGRPAGLSTSPSAQAVEVSTAESWVGYISRPPCEFHFTRRNSRRASGSSQSKSARASMA